MASLTSDSEKAFAIIFCEYKRLRKAGFTKADSIEFTDEKIYAINAFSNWLHPDIDSSLEELKNSGYIKRNIIGDNTLTDNGIKYMESKPAEYFNFVAKFFDIIGIFI